MFAKHPALKVLERPAVFAVILAALISLLTYSHLGHAIRPGPDGSYQYAFNYFFANDIQIGKDILFTYGPLGFLLWPQPIGNNLLIASVVALAAKFLFVLASLLLNHQTKVRPNEASGVFIVGITFLVALQISLHNVLIFLPVVLLLLHNYSGRWLPLILASVVVSLALMVKASAAILSLLALGSYVLAISVRDREVRYSGVVFATLGVVFVLVWFLLYKNLSGLLDYFVATMAFSVGNSSAMTLNPANNWWLAGAFIASYFILPFVLKDKNILFLYGVLALTGMAFFKYAMSREDHVGHLLFYLFQFLYVLFVVSLSIEKKQLVGAVIVFTLLSLFIYSTPYKSSVSVFYQSFHIPFLKEEARGFKAYREDLVRRSNRPLEKRVLDHDVLSVVGSRTVDSYPWDTLYIAANELNWRPRPVIQSYISYTPYLDRKNETFFHSERAPEFLLWEKSHFGGALGSVDDRYLFNDEPLTLLAILTYYYPRNETTDHILLQRAKTPRLKAASISPTKSFKWGEWINVPSETDSPKGVIRARIFVERTVAQRVKMLVYKEFESYITYRLTTGEEVKARLVVDNARSGVWINPFQRGLLDFAKANKVVAIKLSHSKGDYFKPSFLLAWEQSEWQKEYFGVSGFEY